MAEPETDLQSLERFVAENDDLLDLEELIGKFNIFDALGIVRAEIRHSNFLGWLLDPSESHGQKDLFLKAVLMDLFKRTDPAMRPLSPIELDGETLGDVEVRREWRNIDLLIISRDPDFVVAIENKVGSGEHSNQLRKYASTLVDEWPSTPRMHVFLTVDGDDASEEDWVPYSYGDLHRVLTRVRRTNESAIGDDVLTFLDHYLNMVGSRFMEDQKLDELCRRIYQNHRRAIDLITERAMRSGSQVMTAIRAHLNSPESQWIVRGGHARWVEFVPREWVHVICDKTGKGADVFPVDIYCGIEVNPDQCRAWIRVEIGACRDKQLRRRVIEELTKPENRFGFSLKREPKDQWTRVYRNRFLAWKENEDIGDSRIQETLRKVLEEFKNRVVDLPAAVCDFK